MPIPFTQFLRPDGRIRNTTIDMEPDIEAKATQIMEQGVRFEIEELTTGMISMEALLNDQSLASELCPNGQPVINAVRQLVIKAGAAIAKAEEGQSEN